MGFISFLFSRITKKDETHGFLKVAEEIASTLAGAENPLIITSYLGRNPKAVEKLVLLSEKLAIPVLVSCPTTVCFPHSHTNFAELNYGMGESNWIRSADVILIIDSDIPYVPHHNKPDPNAKIFHIDVDVLKDNIGMFHIDALRRCNADGETALSQILGKLNSDSDLHSERVSIRATQLHKHHLGRIAKLDEAELARTIDGSLTVPNLMMTLRKAVPFPERTIFLNESISNFPFAWEHLRPEHPGQMFTSGSSSLGWGLGAAVGVSLAKKGSDSLDLIVLVVGDGSFLFGVSKNCFRMNRER